MFPNKEKIEEIPEEEISLFDLYYLNNESKIIIENPFLLPVKEAILYNISGKKLTEYKDLPVEKLVELPVSKRASGVYIVKLLIRDQKKSLKFIIE